MYVCALSSETTGKISFIFGLNINQCGGSVAWLVALLTIQVDLLIWTLIPGSNPRRAREMLHLSPP